MPTTLYGRGATLIGRADWSVCPGQSVDGGGPLDVHRGVESYGQAGVVRHLVWVPHLTRRPTIEEVAMDGSRHLTLTVPETAELLGVSRAFAYTLVARGELPSLRLGRRVVVPRMAIDALVASSVAVDPDGPIRTGNPRATHDNQPDDDNTAIHDTPTPRTNDPQLPRPSTTRIPRPQTREPSHTLAPGVRGSSRRRAGAR
jgi:excisionase family DNA binding protein